MPKQINPPAEALRGFIVSLRDLIAVGLLEALSQEEVATVLMQYQAGAFKWRVTFDETEGSVRLDAIMPDGSCKNVVTAAQGFYMN